MRGQALFLSTRRDVGVAGQAFSPHGWNLGLGAPVSVHEAHRLDEVRELIAFAEAESLKGRWAALAVAFDAAPAFDPAMRVNAPGGGALAWMSVHEAPAPWPEEGGGAVLSPWAPLAGEGRYHRDLREIHRLIREGETYQVNYTTPFRSEVQGSARALFSRLALAQGAGFCAMFDLGERLLLSFSPELFFLKEGNRLVTRPMKGTAARGRFPAEDEAIARRLAACPKNRAENVMIVDLLRNDLGRVALKESGVAGVQVERLCEVERYPTVWQMTSTVTATLPDGAGLVDVFTALFPCGSVTGAPKIRTMEIIADLERRPRGFYCGALGFVAPGGRAVFNVPIRTLELDASSAPVRALFQVGGGVTHDSDGALEYRECLDKMAFLDAPAMDFRLLETLLLAEGRCRLLQRHMERLTFSAGRLGFACDGEKILGELLALARSTPKGRHKVRLLLDREGGVELQSSPLPAKRPAWLNVAVAGEPVDESDAMLFHKTDRRELYDRHLARHPDCGDVLLWNRRGEVTEGCLSSVVAKIGGRLLTPSLECGLLPGTLRAELLASGVVSEAVLTLDDVRGAQALWLVNSVRGWRRARLEP